MSYESQTPNYDAWIKNVQPGEKVEVFENEWHNSLGVYTIKKDTEHNNATFTRIIPKYNNWGFEYDQENKLKIDRCTIKNYSYADPVKTNNIEDISFDDWYDSIDEQKMYAIEEKKFMSVPLKGNYCVSKHMSNDGEKHITFERNNRIMHKFCESDVDNSITIRDCDNEKYKSYKYYSKNKELTLAEEDLKFPPPFPYGWF
jgi:hypothetical protein